MDVARLRHYKKLTPLTHLHLDHCDVSFRALETILSMPRALQRLELQEYDYGPPSYKYGLTSAEELKAALVPQSQSLKELHIGFRRQSTIFAGPLDFNYFESLESLTVECTRLDNITHAMVVPDSGEERDIMLIASHIEVINAALVWIVVPRFNIKLVLQLPPGYIPSRHTQLMIEGLGQVLRGYNDQRLRVQLVVIRLTERKDAVAPYLHDERIPERVLCYDSLAATQNWNTKTDAEILAAEEERRRMQFATAVSNGTEDTPGDFLPEQLNSA